MAGLRNHLIVVVSGGGSAALGLDYRPRIAAVPARVSPPKNFRRLQLAACGARMGTSSRSQMAYPKALGCECRGAGRPCQRQSPMGQLVPAGWVRVGRLHAAQV
jgi:hypothetical protein